MHRAFRAGGRKAIDKVMRTQPAAFLKLLVLLVPREMEVTHSGGVTEMSDEQLQAGIDMIRSMLAQREAGADAKLVEGVAEPVALPSPSPDVGTSVGRKRKKANKPDGSTGVGGDPPRPTAHTHAHTPQGEGGGGPFRKDEKSPDAIFRGLPAAPYIVSTWSTPRTRSGSGILW